jgi:hypothetical protein
MDRKQLQSALDAFVARLAADRHVLAAVQVGSFADEVLWHKDTIRLWIIEADGVSRRLRSDGDEARIFRTFVEAEVNIHAELIPRSKFKQMVEGSSRTAFSCSFFARRTLVHCTDASIKSWFEKGQDVATKDQKREVLAVTSWLVHTVHHARKAIASKKPPYILHQEALWMLHGLAAIEVITKGEVCEGDILERALDLDPKTFEPLHKDVFGAAPDAKRLTKVVERVEERLSVRGEKWLEPLLAFMRKERRLLPFSEIADHFAHSQLYPWHLESACEWLARRGTVQKLSAPFRITKKSREEVEEPAYLLDV